MEKSALLTGTSSGLGLATAILMAKKGYRVFATMRNLDKQPPLLDQAKAAGATVQVLQLDVTDSASIEAAVNSIIEQTGRIDVLVNNAGAGFAKTLEQASEEELKWVTDVNYFGVARCCRAVIPHMRLAKQGHIVNVTSVGGLVGQPFNELYCAAKFAVEGLTEGLAALLTPSFGIKLTAVEPGGISSEFGNAAAAVTLDKGMPEDAYGEIFQKYLAGFQQRGDTMVYQTPEEIAEVITNVVQAEDPPLRIRTSDWAEEICKLKTVGDPDGAKLLNAVVKTFL